MSKFGYFAPFNRALEALSGACLLGAILLVALSANRWSASALLSGDGTEAKRERRLQAEWEATDAWRERRAEAVREVIAGRMTLLEAAAHFHKVQTMLEARFPAAPRPHPGLAPTERACREVLDHVGAVLEDDPEKAQAVLSRLEAELRNHRKQGTLCLSAPKRIRGG